MKVEFHPAAEQELAAAVTLDEQRSSGLGGELLAEAQRIAELLCDTPNGVVDVTADKWIRSRIPSPAPR